MHTCIPEASVCKYRGLAAPAMVAKGISPGVIVGKDADRIGSMEICSRGRMKEQRRRLAGGYLHVQGGQNNHMVIEQWLSIIAANGLKSERI